MILVDLSSWEEKIHADANDEENAVDESLSTEEMGGHAMFKDGVLTIGCVGRSCHVACAMLKH